MPKRHCIIICVLILISPGLFPAPGYADDVSQAQVLAPRPILLTEVQSGATTAGDEFIELYNQSDEAVDLSGWQIRFKNSTATASALVAVIGEHTVPARTHFLLHTATVVPVPGVLAQQYNARLSSADKAIGLFAPDTLSCEMRVQDALAWGDATAGEGAPLVIDATQKHRHTYRFSDAAGQYVDTSDNKHDWGMAAATATAGTANMQLLPEATSGTPSGTTSNFLGVGIKGCTRPETKPGLPPSPSAPTVPVAPAPPPVITEPEAESTDASVSMPVRNAGLFAPQLSELLPNPVKPKTDASDEFIELYNPNSKTFELSGFMLEVGVKTKKRYVFPAGTLLPAKTFVAYYAKDTNLTLSNAQGQVWLLDPLARVIAQSEPYTSAKDGQAWLMAAKQWQWTTQPTPGKTNMLKSPAAKVVAKETRQAATSGAVQSAATAGSTDTAAAGSQDGKSESDSGLSFNPLHPGVLAATGVIAVLYGLYEYRRDLANKYHQFRRNRATRREARQRLPRR